MQIKNLLFRNPWIAAVIIYVVEMAHVVFLSQKIPIFYTAILTMVAVSLLTWRKWLSPNLWLASALVFVWLIATLHMDKAFVAWVVTLVGLLPMLLLIERVSRRRHLLLYGIWMGLMIYSATTWSAWKGIGIFWENSAFLGPYFVFFTMTFFLALQLALFTAIAGHFYHRRRICQPALMFALIFVLVEYWVPFPFPNEPAVMLTASPILVQIADLFGARSVTMAFCLTAAALYALVSPVNRKTLTPRARWIWIGLLVGVPLFQLGYGAYKMHSLAPRPSGKEVDVAMIQPCSPLHIMNKDHAEKERVAKTLLDLSMKAIRSRPSPPDLLIWPEGEGAIQYMDPRFETSRAFNPEYLAAIREMQGQTSVTLLLSDIKFIPVAKGVRAKGDAIKYHYLNHVSLVGPDGYTRADYTKVIRLPFAEYLPFEQTLLNLQKHAWARYLHGQYRLMFPKTRAVGAGMNRTVFFDVHDSGFAPLICYESLFEDYIREYVQNGAQYLVNVANEGWLGSAYMRKQSMLSSLIRGVENRVPMVRATNSGLSVVTDARGVILAHVPDSEPAFIRATIAPGPAGSFYTKAGYLVPKWVLTPLLLLLWIRASIRARMDTKKRAASSKKIDPRPRQSRSRKSRAA